MLRGWIRGSASALLAIGVVSAAEGQTPRFATARYPLGAHELEFSHGDKVVRGRLGSLHAVYTQGGQVRAITSNDGTTWSSPVAVDPWGGENPALAVDGTGALAAVFPSPFGLRYAFKPFGAATWTVVTLANPGSAAALAARGNRVHIVWTTGSQVRYTTFPTTAPPAVPVVEQVQASTCANSRFSRPAITLIDLPCTPFETPIVAYLLTSDEQANPDPRCASPYTRVGPRIHERSAPNVWLGTFDDIRLDADPASAVEAISLSLSADFWSQDVYLAWSDQQTGNARSMFAKGQPRNFTTVALGPVRKALHVRAANDGYYPPGRFRLATVGPPAAFDEFYSFYAFVQPGTWTGSAVSPTWGVSQRLSFLGGGYVGRPQALYWERRDTNGLLQEASAFYELEQLSATERLATLEPPRVPYPRRLPWTRTYDCVGNLSKLAPAVGIKTVLPGGPGAPSKTETWVDFEETGRVVEVNEHGLEVGTFTGGTVTVAWPAGTVVTTVWPGGFAVEASPEALTFSSLDTEIETSELVVPDDPPFEDHGTCAEPEGCGP